MSVKRIIILKDLSIEKFIGICRFSVSTLYRKMILLQYFFGEPPRAWNDMYFCGYSISIPMNVL